MELDELTALGVGIRIRRGAKGVDGHAMAIFEKTSKFALDEPSAEEISEHSERQLVTNTVGKDASAGTARIHFMRVLPMAEGAGNLEVAELAPFDVVAMHEGPANFERSHANSQYATVAITDSGCSLQDFNGLPRRRKAFEGVGLRMPPKNFLGGRVDTRLRDEMKLVWHACAWSFSCESGIENFENRKLG
jgi:hypothetical protein